MDSSKILTVLTGSEGKLTVTARGALRRGSKFAAAAQLLVFSEMTLFHSRDRWTLTEARSVEQFAGLRDDIELLALGSYFAELVEAASDEDSPSRELMPLFLNALYALSERMKTPEIVKPAFELRLMAASGFAPVVSGCALCGRTQPRRAVLDIEGGCMRCEDCAHSEGPRLSAGAISAARYIIGCEAKKLFSFTLSKEALHELYIAAEQYLLAQYDRRFRTLEFYKTVRS